MKMNYNLRLNRPLIRGDVRVFTKNRTFLLGRVLRPRTPPNVNPNDPWWGVSSWARGDGHNMRYHVGRYVR